MADGSIVELRDASVQGDSLVGKEVRTSETRVIKMTNIATLETGSLDGGRSIVFAGIATAVIWGAVTVLKVFDAFDH